MDCGSASIADLRGVLHKRHDSDKYRGADGAGNRSEGCEKGRGIRHLPRFHIVGAPGEQRHHQTSDGNVPEDVENTRRSQRRIQRDKAHTEVRDQQKDRAEQKDSLDSDLIKDSSGERADKCSCKRSRQGNQTGYDGGIPHDSLHIQRHHDGRTHHDEIQQHTRDHTDSVILVGQDFDVQKWRVETALSVHEEGAADGADQQRQSGLNAENAIACEIANTERDTAECRNALDERKRVEFFVLQLQYIFKCQKRHGKGEGQDDKDDIEDGLPAKRVDHQTGDSRCDNRRSRRRQTIGTHHGSLFLNRIQGEDDDLRCRHQDAVSARLKHAADHHDAEISGQDAEEKTEQEYTDAGEVQSSDRKFGDQKGSERHDDSHGKGIAARDPLTGGGADVEK